MALIEVEPDYFKPAEYKAFEPMLFQNKGENSDEYIVRKALVKEWTRILEKYARPGVAVPSVEAVRRELIKVGVDAGVEALTDAHWFVFSFMVRGQVQDKIESELNRFDLKEFVDDVKAAQTDPALLQHLRQKIHNFVLVNR